VDAQRVILAGIDDEKMDLFLLLNEGAGYRVVGIVDAGGQGETSQIAEILGVRAYSGTDIDHLPPADIVIYGDDRFRSLGERLGLSARQVWHQSQAWDYLTNGEQDRSREHREEREPETPAPSHSSAPVHTTPLPEAFVPEPPKEAPANEPAREEDLVTLGAFARSLGDLEHLYEWVLERAMGRTGAVAGGILPAEPLRPAVWRDRRALPSGRRPAFLDRHDAQGATEFTLGLPNQAGTSRLVLVGGSPSDAELAPLARAVGPAFQWVAELEDLRRTFAHEALVRDLTVRVSASENGRVSLEELCRALASAMRARECVLLFRDRDGERLSGASSRGGAVSMPAGSALAGISAEETVHSGQDAGGLWFYVTALGADGRGFLGLYGVPASAGRGESFAHEVRSLARVLSERLPDLSALAGS